MTPEGSNAVEPTPDNRHLSRFCVLNSATGRGLQDSTYILQLPKKGNGRRVRGNRASGEPSQQHGGRPPPPPGPACSGTWGRPAPVFPFCSVAMNQVTGMWVMPGTSDVPGRAFHCFAKWPCIYRHVSLQRTKQNEAQFNRQDQTALLNK